MRMYPGAMALAFAVVAFAGFAAGENGPFSTELLGANEVSPGDLDGSGTAVIRLIKGQGEVCFDLAWANIEDPTAAHIHRGAVGVNGPIAVGLFTGLDTDGSTSGCIENVDPELIKEIRQNPERFYINIHNATFPGGAIRGQLGL